jgi:lysozyme family protein
MTVFDCAMSFILKAEGAESDDPQDPGLLTRYGISQRAHPDIAVATLTEGEAIALYWRRYWQAADLALLPAPLSVAVMDGVVQHGQRPAIRMLQHSLRVETDGVIGPVTVAAALRADMGDLVTAYCARRAVYYANLGHFGRFGYGWMRRLFCLAAYCRTLAA